MDNILYPIALTCIKGIGPMLAKRLIEQLGSAERIFREKRGMLERTPGIGQTLAEAIIRQRDEALQRAGEELEFIRRYGIRTYYIDDANYPTRLKQCQDAPLVLFGKGETDLNAAHFIGIVGTRRPTEQGRNNCHKLVADIAQALPGTVIVSGLAYGIDVCAHRGALANNLSTVAVLGHGLDRIYPASHRRTAIEMLEQGGLLTEYLTGSLPDRYNFVQRNRIVAGMSDATIVVESAAKGGSLITADLANSYNRDCFAVPGRIGDSCSEGCNRLIHDNKAALLLSADDLVKAMGWEPRNARETVGNVQRSLFLDLSEEEALVVRILMERGELHINTLVVAADIPVNRMSALLFELEMKGVVRVLAGGVYRLV